MRPMMCQVWFHAFLVKSDEENQRRPNGIAMYIYNSPSPHPLSSRKFKKALKLPSHRCFPTPTAFHFLPPPYIFAPISLSSLLFQVISISPLPILYLPLLQWTEFDKSSVFECNWTHKIKQKSFNRRNTIEHLFLCLIWTYEKNSFATSLSV